jgi:hypothetical protein
MNGATAEVRFNHPDHSNASHVVHLYDKAYGRELAARIVERVNS